MIRCGNNDFSSTILNKSIIQWFSFDVTTRTHEFGNKSLYKLNQFTQLQTFLDGI